jgi:hypothetical protein
MYRVVWEYQQQFFDNAVTIGSLLIENGCGVGLDKKLPPSTLYL